VTESLAATPNIQVDDLEVMSTFFERYYGEADLGTKFQEMRRKAKFRSVADDFEMISSRTQDVFVPYGDGAAAIDQLYQVGQLTGDLRRRLQRYTVGLQPWEFQQAKTTVLSELRSESEIWIAVNPAYDERKGLQIMQQTGGVFG
jgi:hypothetical protein